MVSLRGFQPFGNVGSLILLVNLVHSASNHHEFGPERWLRILGYYGPLPLPPPPPLLPELPVLPLPLPLVPPLEPSLPDPPDGGDMVPPPLGVVVVPEGLDGFEGLEGLDGVDGAGQLSTAGIVEPSGHFLVVDGPATGGAPFSCLAASPAW